LALKNQIQQICEAKHETGRDSWARGLSLLRQSSTPALILMPLVQEVREARATTVMQCGTMQVLDMIQPIGTTFISVNILETITGRKRRKSLTCCKALPWKT